MQGPTAQGQVSPDGQFIWDGGAWQPIVGSGWEPTSWTRPLQLSVSLYWAVAAAITFLTPILFGQAIREAALKQMQAQSQQLTSDQQQQALNLGVTFAFVFAVIFALVYVALAVLSFIRRLTWVFYVDLVLLGLSAIGIVTNLIALRNGGQPAGVAGISLTISVVALALFIWMLVARIQRGVWGCRKVPVMGAA